MTTQAATAGQVSRSAAEIYDEFFVPALFGEWAPRLCDAAKITPGSAVLDVACGTGATTREAANRIGPNGRVVGLDRNNGMLDVAHSHATDIEWVEGLAEDLPFETASFDTVLCQFGLMFFDDRSAALREMTRVVRPGGHIALSVWDDVANSPGYAQIIALIEKLFGREPADALRAPFVLGDRQDLQQVLNAGGLAEAAVTTPTGTARFASIRDWVKTDVYGWTLTDFFDEAGFEALVTAAETELNQLSAADGSVAFAAPAHVVVWKAPGKEN